MKHVILLKIFRYIRKEIFLLIHMGFHVDDVIYLSEGLHSHRSDLNVYCVCRLVFVGKYALNHLLTLMQHNREYT